MWAADGRQKAEWQRAASMAVIQVRSISGAKLDPADLMPNRYRERLPEKTPEQKARETRAAVRLLGSFFRDREA